MKEYLKEKLKIDADIYKLYITIILVLSGGLASLILGGRIGAQMADTVLFVIGFIFLAALSVLCYRKNISINRNLELLKNS